jgi:hypothetical protein
MTSSNDAIAGTITTRLGAPGGVRANVTGPCPAAVAAVHRALRDLKTCDLAAGARPGLRARWRRHPLELVTIVLTGPPRHVLAVARAIAGVVVVAGMSHHVTDGRGSTGTPIIRLDVTCYPPQRIDVSQRTR